MRFWSVFGSALLLAPATFAVTRRDDRDDSLYTSLAGTFPSVGLVSTNTGSGTGTLISSQWVLTAAHVIDNSASNKQVRFGDVFYDVESVVQYDGWELGKNDFALLKLSGNGVTSVSPVSYWQGGDEVGKEAVGIGFGGGGTGLTGVNEAAGVKRAFRNVIDAKDIEGLPGLAMDFDRPDGLTNSLGSVGSSASPLDLEGNVVPGDSGGGLFAEMDGRLLLVGVTSYLWWPEGDPGVPYGRYGQGSGFSYFSQPVNDWILANTGVQAVPEPGTFAAIGLGLAALARRRRRRA